MGGAPRASAVQEAAQRPRRGAPARSVLDGASTALCSMRRGAQHTRSRLIGGRKSNAIPSVDAASGTLRWAHASGGPPAGVAYTLEGIRRPERIVLRELPPLVRGLDEAAPSARRLLLRRFDAFGGRGAT